MKSGENPFRTERLERVSFRLPEGVTWDDLLSRLRELNFRAAVIGPHGSGKTTFLDHLAPRLAAKGFLLHRVRLDTETRSLPRCAQKKLFSKLGPRDLIVLDGAEQLNPIRWTVFRAHSRHAGGLLITTHRAGRLPTLIQFRPTTQLLSELIRELLPDQEFTLNPSTLFTAHDGNLRHALLACYDYCAGRQV